MKYDFILFENYHQAQNHKFDVVLIARMLKSQGLSVAILDVYGEDDAENLEGVPVIHLPFALPVPNDSWRNAPKNKFHSLRCKLRFMWQQHRYMREVLAYITPLAHQFYFGSYHSLMSSLLLRVNKSVYLWGLRSNRMTGFWKRLKRYPIESIQLLRLKHGFFRNPNCKLFVSNEIIRDEFRALGVDPDRMVVREERCAETIGANNLEWMDESVSFIVIGQLRKDKNVPLTVEAFRKADISSSNLYVVGRSQGEYEQTISSVLEGDSRIIRKNEYLEYEDFLHYIARSHFVLFADDQGDSCITNGTLIEALINYRPIICPDYNPYTYYINKYHVGLTYKAGDAESYALALRQAAALGVEHFIPSISCFLATITFERVSQRLVDDIKKKK